jgi:hypothetical protein
MYKTFLKKIKKYYLHYQKHLRENKVYNIRRGRTKTSIITWKNTIILSNITENIQNSIET